MFNWLQPVINGSNCLDLYAGTGALGFEAISRGAANVVLVEQNPLAAEQLQKNIETLGATGIRLERSDALQWLQHARQKFDLVFLDPPFGQGLIEKSCALLQENECLRPGALIYVEAEQDIQIPSGFTIKKQGIAGQVNYMLLEPVN
ncbi:MAG: rRNA ((966)-N(2))-methyltransferase RsmD [Gammaproteobacteria bacterium]|nr:rRNA ((966)-N(2))-methyltransferase RsmD [Gammaproteobacteria bacterium]